MRVRIVGASSPFPREKLAAGVAVLRAHGFDVDDHDVSRGSHAYLNGSDDERVFALEAAFDSGADVVWLARGGYGLTRIVDRLRVPKRPPLVVGFSDATALFARLHNDGHAQRCIHGPLATSIASEPEATVAHVVDVVRGGFVDDLPRIHNHVVNGAPHDAAGRLFAGNLCVLAALCGTKQQPDLKGHVVVIEEVGERPYRLDRMLTQCLNAGLFRGVNGVIVGHLTGCEEPASQNGLGRDPAPRALDVVVERLSTLGVPLWSGLPAGHEAPNWALPLGRGVVVSGNRLVIERAAPPLQGRA